MLSLIISSVDIEDSAKDKFEKIYYKYKNLLFTYAKNIVNNEYDAEDVLQNAFIKIARNIKSVGNIESRETASFLIVITKNTAYDFLRKKNRYNEVIIDKLPEVDYVDQCIEDLVERLDFNEIVSCIKNIPSPYREVLYFHYVNDCSIKQTALLLQRKSATVKMQLIRGKKILIKELSEVLYD